MKVNPLAIATRCLTGRSFLMYIICFGSVVESVTGVAALNKPPESLSGREVTRSLHIVYTRCRHGGHLSSSAQFLMKIYIHITGKGH